MTTKYILITKNPGICPTVIGHITLPYTFSADYALTEDGSEEEVVVTTEDELLEVIECQIADGGELDILLIKDDEHGYDVISTNMSDASRRAE